MTTDNEQPPWLTKQDYFPEEEFYTPIGEIMWSFGWLDWQLELVLYSPTLFHKRLQNTIATSGRNK